MVYQYITDQEMFHLILSGSYADCSFYIIIVIDYFDFAYVYTNQWSF
jgi:hypothetical protein